MKRLLTLMLLSLPAFANIVDSTYAVTPPVSATNCPAIQPGIEFPCYYVAIGEYVDTYLFTVPADASYSFEVTGTHWRRCTVSGHRICYVEDSAIVWAAVVDAAGVLVAELANTAEDDWTVAVQLPPGDYALLISGAVGGNRPGVYGYSISYDSTQAIVNDPTPIIVDGAVAR